MRKNQKLDQKITQAFKIEAEKIEIDDRVKRDIDRIIRNSENRKEKLMKHFSLKKKVIIGIVCCGLVSTAILAAGTVTSLVSHTNLLTVCKDFSKLEEQEKKLGYEVNVVKDFTNGYSFEHMSVDEVAGQDDQGNTVEVFKQLVVAYKNAEGKHIGLYVNQRDAGSEFDKADKTLQCGDVTLYFYLCTNKVVPPDYELTDEDKKNQESGTYYISYGSDKVEIIKISSVQWDKDGTRYDMIATETDMTSDEMLNMASELVQ